MLSETYRRIGPPGDRLVAGEFASRARRSLRVLIDSHRLPDLTRSTVLCLAGEVFANFHLHTDSPELECRYSIAPGYLIMKFRYESELFNPTPPLPDPEDLAKTGRGLFLIHALADRCRIDFEEGFVTVDLRLHWFPMEPAPADPASVDPCSLTVDCDPV